MIRSLYSAITGLKNHQVKMDVIGNNIANINTTGFKRSRASFSNLYNQTIKNATDPISDPNKGTTNSVQIGLGVGLSSIDKIMTQGPSQSTGNSTDMMIQGNGMFILSNGTKLDAAGTPVPILVYSRAGGFEINKNGDLQDPSGALVQGVAITDDTIVPAVDWTTNPAHSAVNIKLGSTSNTTNPLADPNLVLTSYSIDQKGIVTGVYSDGTKQETHKIAQLAVAKFDNYAGLDNVGGNYFAPSSSSGAVQIMGAGDKDLGSVVSGALEMSNVDLSQEFTDMIVAQRGFQANSRVITVSDTLLQEMIDLKRS